MSLRNTHFITKKFNEGLAAITEAIETQLSESYDAISVKEHHDRGYDRIRAMELNPSVVSSFCASDKSDDTIIAFKHAYIEECLFHSNFPYGAVTTIRTVFDDYLRTRHEVKRVRDRLEEMLKQVDRLEVQLSVANQAKEEEQSPRVAYNDKINEQCEALTKANKEIDSLTEENEKLKEQVEALKAELYVNPDDIGEPGVKVVRKSKKK